VKVLFDECLPRRLSAQLTGHEVKTVPQAGWAGIKNGDLLKLAETSYDAFVTVDRNLSFQQNIPKLGVAVVVLHANSNRFEDLLPLVPKILTVLDSIQRGEVMEVSA
jgi:Domain of unknown function (DUF5615)